MKHKILLMLLSHFSLCCSGCALSTDPEYAHKSKQARNDWKENEIVGVWVSRAKVLGQDGRSTLLCRPDGTGVIRESYSSQTRESPFKWSYAGNGVWKGTYHWPVSLTIHFSGHDLLVKFVGYGIWPMMKSVFVPAGDAASVEAHVRKRD